MISPRDKNTDGRGPGRIGRWNRAEPDSAGTVGPQSETPLCLMREACAR
jgi:hypothetical protein